jgi:hypothetical protein
MQLHVTVGAAEHTAQNQPTTSTGLQILPRCGQLLLLYGSTAAGTLICAAAQAGSSVIPMRQRMQHLMLHYAAAASLDHTAQQLPEKLQT